ncbi:MAG: hypothetical protein ABIJ34_04640 [archaeon]
MPENQILTVIIGSHDIYHSLDSFLKKELEAKGYEVTIVNSYDEMINLVQKNDYTLYLMDLNLDYPATDNITSSINVFKLIKERVEQKKATFIGYSRWVSAITKATKLGIPSCNTMALEDYFESTLAYFTKGLVLN